MRSNKGYEEEKMTTSPAILCKDFVKQKEKKNIEHTFTMYPRQIFTKSTFSAPNKPKIQIHSKQGRLVN